MKSCFKAALDGRWRWARDHRPEPIILSEEEALLPAARGWTWLWDEETRLWHASTPSSYEGDRPSSELKIDNIVSDAIDGGFVDMEIVSYMAHGYPGPTLEKSVVIGAPHVGALKLVDRFVKSATKDRLRKWVKHGRRLPWVWPVRSDPQNVVVQKDKGRMTTDKTIELAPGVMSYNAAVVLESIWPIEYVKVSQLGRAIAILQSCGAPVSLWGFDLEAFFRKTPKQRLDLWMSGTCQWDGYGLDGRVQFGQREAPVLCGRQSNFMVWAIRRELDRLGALYPTRDANVKAFLARRSELAEADLEESDQHVYAVMYFICMYVDDGGGVCFDDLIYDVAGTPLTRSIDGTVVHLRRAQLYGEACAEVIRRYGHAESDGKSTWRSTTLDFLGCTLDVSLGMIYLMEAKRKAYRALCTELIGGSALPGGCVKAPGEELNSLIHKLLHASSATPLGRQHLFHLLKARRDSNSLDSGHVLNRHALNELRWWEERLNSCVGAPLAARQKWPATSEKGHLIVYGDASRELSNPGESGFGGWCVLGLTLFYIEGRWSVEELGFSINVLEAIILDMLTGVMIDLASELDRSGDPRAVGPVTHVSEFSDNTAAEHSSERGKPSQWAMQYLVTRRYEELRERGIYQHTMRVASVERHCRRSLSRRRHAATRSKYGASMRLAPRACGDFAKAAGHILAQSDWLSNPQPRWFVGQR